MVLVDGGLFANNPAMSAYVEAKSLYKDATDFLVVSIGTGQLAKQLEYNTKSGLYTPFFSSPRRRALFELSSKQLLPPFL